MATQYILLIKKQLLLFLLAFLSLNNYSQEDQQVMDKKELKALEKEKREAQKKEIEENERKLVEYMIDNKKFVLEANYLSGKSGPNIPVNSNLNFISIDSNECVIQLANTSGIGNNGLGGVTVEGPVTKYEVTKKETKHGVSYTVMLSMRSSLGTYDICVWTSPDGYADATISGITAGRLNYSGKLEPLQGSHIYKGNAYP
jgi:hypothetical protein